MVKKHKERKWKMELDYLKKIMKKWLHSIEDDSERPSVADFIDSFFEWYSKPLSLSSGYYIVKIDGEKTIIYLQVIDGNMDGQTVHIIFRDWAGKKYKSSFSEYTEILDIEWIKKIDLNDFPTKGKQ
jgi:hypothetical protein